MKFVNVVGKMARDIAIASGALLVAKASEAAAKKAWSKALEMKAAYDKSHKNLSSYKGVINETESNETK